MLVMGILLMWEGVAQNPRAPDGVVIVLAGPAGAQKIAQAEFLRRRYGKDSVFGDYPSTREQSERLAALVKQKHLPAPIVIQIADRFQKGSPLDVYGIESNYPGADIWTLDGTRPVETVSRTLQNLLDRTPGK